MSLFLRLLVVVSTAVLLRDSHATIVITAPSTVIEDNAGLETRDQGPTAWICSALAVNSPWTAYANIRGYLEGGNAEDKDYTNMVLYPVMELFHASESRLCVYLPAVDHCFPPAPSSNQVKAVKQLYNKKYYDIRFWGQASNTRIDYYQQKLTAALNAQNKSANLNIFFVSYFSDHVREVRYDHPLMPRVSTSGPPTVNAQEYILTSVEESRLGLFDVQTQILFNSSGQSQDDCATAAANVDINAFSFVNGVCKLYKFEEEFRPCLHGDFEIYINKNRLGAPKELTRDTPVLEGLKKVVIYSELPLPYAEPVGNPEDTQECEMELKKSDPISSVNGYFVLENQCLTAEGSVDILNCNQICRGEPINAIVKTVNEHNNPPILSLCGQTVTVQRRTVTVFKGLTTAQYFSHAGSGCYPYQDPITPEEENCVVNFEMGGKDLVVLISPINLNRENDTCIDTVSIYDVTNRITSKCYGRLDVSITGNNFTVNFHRNLNRSSGNINNIENKSGFKMMLFTVS